MKWECQNLKLKRCVRAAWHDNGYQRIQYRIRVCLVCCRRYLIFQMISFIYFCSFSYSHHLVFLTPHFLSRLLLLICFMCCFSPFFNSLASIFNTEFLIDPCNNRFVDVAAKFDGTKVEGIKKKVKWSSER